jgi:hypothetical protein
MLFLVLFERSSDKQVGLECLQPGFAVLPCSVQGIALNGSYRRTVIRGAAR